MNEVVIPTIEGFVKDNLNYRGFVFFGLINVDGNPKVIEYNVRMGDPETEVVIPRMEAPGILDIQPKIRPTGQMALQNGR